MGIFDSLNIGYSGLSTSQSGINTTSHNISNANTEGYSKQRISQKVNYPIHNLPGDVGAGTHVETITRSHDEFVYGRLKSSNSNVAYSDKMEKTLQEITTYAPDLDNLGIAKDIKDFFSSWSDVAQNPNDDSQKVVLLRSMESMTQNLNEASTSLHKLQDRLNEEFKNGIDKVNKLASEIVEVNKGINKVENSNSSRTNANDLRDQRDKLELELAKMLNIDVSKTKAETEYGVKANRTDRGVDYNINVGGFNLVDGVTFHPLRAEDGVNDSKLNSAYYIDHNQKRVDITGSIRGGELGAVVHLRGERLDSDGRAVNSKIQGYIDNLDTFAKSFKQAVNSIYASTAQESIVTDDLSSVGKSGAVLNIDGVKEGSFDIKVYDNLGNEVATKSITIDSSTTLQNDIAGNSNPNSIVEQINKNSDDNGDNDGTNDLDDYFKASITSDGKLQISALSEGNYTIAIEDNGTNFAGATGVNKLFDGKDAKSITVSNEIRNNSSNIRGNKAPIDGNSDLANQMVALQYESLSFKKPDGEVLNQSIEAFYRYTSSKVATDAHQSSINKDAAEVLNKTVSDEMKSVSSVDMDEELVNLMKYQAAYQANAKLITTVDRMIDTLLGMKQ